jgi:tRNA U34 2-thiouridine synthase MnmA/TrmU
MVMNTAMDTNTNTGFLRCDDAMKSVTFSHKISNWIRILSERGGEYDMVVRMRRRQNAQSCQDRGDDDDEEEA